MRAMYMGKEGEVTIFGLTFPRGEAVDVPESNAHARLKLPKHPEFVIDEAPSASKPEKSKK